MIRIEITKAQQRIKLMASPLLLTKILADFLFGFYLLN